MPTPVQPAPKWKIPGTAATIDLAWLIAALVVTLPTVVGTFTIIGAQAAQPRVIEGTIASYENSRSWGRSNSWIQDLLQPLRDYRLTLGAADRSTGALTVSAFDFENLPDLSGRVGSPVTVSVDDGTGRALALEIDGQNYTTPYAAHPQLKRWDEIATGLAWFGPLAAFVLFIWWKAHPVPRKKSIAVRRKYHAEDGGASLVLPYGAWFFTTLVVAYLLRTRAASVEFWILLYSYFLGPQLLAPGLSRFSTWFDSTLPLRLRRQSIDYSRTFLGVGDSADFLLTFTLVALLQIGLVLGIREALFYLGV